MLILHRSLQPWEVRTCKISGDMINYGDYYYESTIDGSYISADTYHKLKREREEERFDYTLLNQAMNEEEYRDYIKRAESEYLTQTILDEPLIKNGRIEIDGESIIK